jgi:hypothetical protein
VRTALDRRYTVAHAKTHTHTLSLYLAHDHLEQYLFIHVLAATYFVDCSSCSSRLENFTILARFRDARSQYDDQIR